MKNRIKKSFGFAMLATTACFAISSTSFAMTDAECNAAWTTADANKDGFVTKEEGARYHAAIRVGDKTITGNYILDIGSEQGHPCARQGGTNHGEVRHG